MEALTTYSPRFPKLRVGRDRDGGYVIVTGLEYDAFLSCGINDEVSFDIGFTQLYPHTPAFAFDGTVERPHDLPPNMRFVKKNIGVVETRQTTDLKHLLGQFRDIFLKMDIEGHEWTWLACLDATHMASLKQIVIEVHGLGSHKHVLDEVKCDILKMLSKTHKLVHVHGNNYGKILHSVPTVLELTYVRDDVGVSGLNAQPLPDPSLDLPNNPKKADVNLNFWPFVTS